MREPDAAQFHAVSSSKGIHGGGTTAAFPPGILVELIERGHITAGNLFHVRTGQFGRRLGFGFSGGQASLQCLNEIHVVHSLM